MKNPVIKLICFCLVLSMGLVDSFGQSEKEDILFRKNFYLLYLLEKEYAPLNGQPFKEVRGRLEQDARHAVQQCKTAGCYGSTLQFTDAEISSIGDELVRLSAFDTVVGQLIGAVRRSGCYYLFDGEADTAFIRKAWVLDARGVNYILSTYLGGKVPLYPKIDSISFNKEDPAFGDKVTGSVKKWLKKNAGNFYRIPLLLALEALRLNGRDEAARYEPLLAKENAAAFHLAAKVNWDQYTYSAILVPGLGPEQPGVKLDPNGAKRCDSAAARYHAGKAPFLVVSGGHVHPNKTPYCEAVEMKKYMVEVLHIPAAAIIIEPHARHTTTNLRNANRILFMFHIPANKPVMIVTDASQNNYITGTMGNRVLKELGYLPFTSIKKLSATETEYIPAANSLHINPLDPLDP